MPLAANNPKSCPIPRSQHGLCSLILARLWEGQGDPQRTDLNLVPRRSPPVQQYPYFAAFVQALGSFALGKAQAQLVPDSRTNLEPKQRASGEESRRSG